MGAETEMQAGLGVQLGAGNRWGDYSCHDSRSDRPVHLLLYERVLKDERRLQLVYPDRCLQVPILRLGREFCTAQSPAQSLHRKQVLRFLA